MVAEPVSITGREKNRGGPEPVLSVRDLVTRFDTRYGRLTAVRGVSFDLYPGETLGVVGESGSGKSVTMMSVLGLLPPNGRVVGGQVRLGDRDLLSMRTNARRSLQGKEIATIFQDPMSSLNPVLSIGAQIVESLRFHQQGLGRKAARQRAAELLRIVGVPNPEQRLDEYPHQYSGGMRQRAMIAMALANDPRILIADEPTTALDVTTQAQILGLLKDAKARTGAAAIIVTHDLGVVAETADRVMVMYAGRVVEVGDVEQVFRHPRHPYTHALLASSPRVDERMDKLAQIQGRPPDPLETPPGCPFQPRCHQAGSREICRTELPPLQQIEPAHWSACHFAAERFADLATRPAAEVQAAGGRAVAQDEVLRIEGLKVHFPIVRGVLRRPVGTIRAVDGIDLVLHRAETLGIVGESGCGKTTTGRAIVRLVDPTEGRVVFKGEDVTGYDRDRLRSVRRSLQIVFQDPYSSLDPRMKVGALVGEALRIHGAPRPSHRDRVRRVLDLVGLRAEDADRYPHEFSGGQRQRIAVARSIILDPDVLVLDEPVSALDVSVQAQTINLLMDLQRELNMAFVFVAHDLAVVRHISHRVAVMYLGKVVEAGDNNAVYENPLHPYTQALLSAVPVADVDAGERPRIVLSGEVPSAANPPSGCRFRTRCFKAQSICAEQEPPLVYTPTSEHTVACHFPGPHPIPMR
ncbi:ABC transporter ATP-binding protein [Jiangella ureilytica]|nr:ABC transporter ATP-binding protein [Jiangella ureilytica]